MTTVRPPILLASLSLVLALPAGADDVLARGLSDLSEPQRAEAAAWIRDEAALTEALRAALAPVQEAWLATLAERGGHLDPSQTRPRGFHRLTEDSILRELAFSWRAPAALAGVAGLEKNFVPKCSICDGSRVALERARPRAEALLVPSPRVLANPPATPDLTEVGRVLDALLAHRARLPGILSATEAGRALWQRVIDEHGTLDSVLELVRTAMVEVMGPIEAIDPEGARKLAEGYAAEKEKMDALASQLYDRKICWFCTAGAEGVCHRAER